MRSLLPAAALSALLFTACSNNDPVDLKFNLQPGARYQYTIDTKQDMTQKMGGSEMKVAQSMTFQTTYAIQSATGGQRDIAVTYDRIALKQSGPAMNQEWDSADPAKQDPTLKMLGGLIGKSFTMTATENGEITRVGGLEDLVASTIDPTDPNAALLRQQLSQIFNDSSMRQMLGQAMQMYPGKPVRPGDTWTKSTTTTTGPFAMTLDNTYTLERVKDSTAVVKVNTKVAGRPNPAAGMPGISMELKGSQSGTMDVAVASGLMTSAKLMQDIKGSMTVNNITVPMTINSTTTIKGVKR